MCLKEAQLEDHVWKEKMRNHSVDFGAVNDEGNHYEFRIGVDQVDSHFELKTPNYEKDYGVKYGKFCAQIGSTPFGWVSARSSPSRRPSQTWRFRKRS